MQILRLIDTLFSTESIGLIATAFGIIYPTFGVDTQSQKKYSKSKEDGIFYEIRGILESINNFCKYTYGCITFDSKVQNYYILKFTINNIFIHCKLYLDIKKHDSIIIINLILTVCSLILYHYIENVFNEKNFQSNFSIDVFLSNLPQRSIYERQYKIVSN